MNKLASTEFEPASMTPPGATLGDLLAEWRMSQADLAARMGRPAKTINEIIKGKSAITEETALQLSSVLGPSAEFWMERELRYRLSLARKAERTRLGREKRWLKRFPVEDMVRRGVIPGGLDPVGTLRAIWAFFGVAGPEPWREVYEGIAAPAQRLPAEALAVWLRMGEVLAHGLPTDPFNAVRFREALLEIRGVTLDGPAAYLDRITVLCRESGVALVFVERLPSLDLWAASRWVGPDKALIQLVPEFRTHDRLWLALLHSAAHVLWHGKKRIFLEAGDPCGREEDEAVSFASDLLIPDRILEGFAAPGASVTRAAIAAHARAQGIHPGLLVFRMQMAGCLSTADCNDLKLDLAPAEAPGLAPALAPLP